MDEVVKMAATEGVMTALAVALIAWIIKSSSAREDKLMQHNLDLTERLRDLADIKEGVKEIKNKVGI